MAISLASISKGGNTAPPRIVIHGPPGIGKTTFAAGAPSPVFIQCEDGLGNLEVPAFPLVSAWPDVLDSMGALYADKHEYKTVVIDSLSALELLIWKQVADDHDHKSIEDMGYGKGYVFALNYWTQLLDGVNALRDKGMMVVMIAHTDVVRFDSPESEPFDRYLIKLHKRAFQLLYERADIIGFANYQTAVVKSDVGFNAKVARGVEIGGRRLHLIEKPAFVAKNRYSMPESVDLKWSAMMAAIGTPKAKSAA